MPRRPRDPRKRDDVSEDQYTAAFEVFRHHVAFLFAAVRQRHQLASQGADFRRDEIIEAYPYLTSESTLYRLDVPRACAHALEHLFDVARIQVQDGRPLELASSVTYQSGPGRLAIRLTSTVREMILSGDQIYLKSMKLFRDVPDEQPDGKPKHQRTEHPQDPSEWTRPGWEHLPPPAQGYHRIWVQATGKPASDTQQRK